MIYFYSGTPGSGKTLHAMKDIAQFANDGKMVVSNIELNRRPLLATKSWQYCYIPNEELKPSLFLANSEPMPEDSRLLIIDEAQLIFNSRNWNDEDRKTWVKFFTQHRKLGWKIILIAQNIDMIDKQIRALIEVNTQHRRIGSYGVTGAVLSAITLNRVYVGVCYYSGSRVKVGNSFFVRGPFIGRMYSSSQMLDSDFTGDSTGLELQNWAVDFGK